MPDYNKTKIYKIWSHLGDKIYIGSTCKNYLCERMTSHRSDYNNWKKNNTRDRISSYDLFEEYGIKNCLIELLEEIPCTSKDEKKKHEGKYIRSLKCVNRIVPDRTKEEKKEMKKKRYEKNKEKILMNKKENKIKNKNMNGYVPPFNKETWSKDKIICICGSEHRRDRTKVHITTKKHLSFITSQTI